MGLKLCVLASGSSGNSVWLATPLTSVLIDAGLSAKQLAARLESIGERLDRVAGICLTHEHEDHTKGVRVIQKQFNIPIYANGGTIDGYRARASDPLVWKVFLTGRSFEIGDLTIEPFSVPHDSYEPVGYVVSNREGIRVGVVTDMGVPTRLIETKLRDCDALVVESNHDEKLLEQSPRSWQLKGRIKGRQGHLSNRQAADLLAGIGSERLRRVFLAHLSNECNYPELALSEIKHSLRLAGHSHIEVTCAFPDRVSDIWTVQ